MGFELGPYDSSQSLIIDPVVSYSTYLGGSSTGAVTGLAVDSAGDLYATGWTAALNFPIAGAVQATNQGGVDAFVVKLNAAGTALIYATYIGGRGADQGAAIAVDSLGQAYVTGFTASTNFPLASPIRTTLGGGRSAFALKLNANGNLLLYSTYLGGTNYDMGTAIAVDGSGNAYIAGDAQSANFPVTSGAFQTALDGQTNAFVTKLTSSGAISFSTFLGGSAVEHAGGIAVDSGGNVYVAGGTFSLNFPLANAIQSVNGGGQDAFVTKLNPSGSAILYSTYLGGAGGTQASPEQANAIAVDASGNAYITGVTNSSNFPVSAGAFQTAFGGGVQDAFVSKINASGNTLAYSTYLGGSSFDWGAGIGVGPGGAAYIAGYTSSADFPLAGALQSFNGLYDAFIAEFSAAGNALVFSTYLGGTGFDNANALALDSSGNIFTGGQTNSTNFPLQTPIESANNGGSTGWLLRLGVTAPPPQLPAVNSVTPSSGTGSTVIFTAVFSDPAGASSLTAVSLLVNASASLNSACYVSYSPAANQFTLANDVASSGSIPIVPGGGSGQNDQCTINGRSSTATISATTLTLNVSLTFQPGFEGNKTVYLYATSAGANTGLVALGAWTATIPAAQPSVGSVSPNGSTGSSQTFSFVFSDSQNVANIADVAMLFAPSLVFQNTCYVVYDAVQGLFQLAYDNAGGSNAKSVNSIGTLQNSQCTVGGTTVTISGLSLILSVSITFNGVFSGLQDIFLDAVDVNGASTGWVQSGTYTVAAGGVPVANSVVPSSGSGSSQRFTFTISDQGGSGFLTDLEVVIGATNTTVNSCVLLYDRTRNTVSLSYNNPSNGVAELVPGSSTVISNSQCSLLGANTTVAYGVTAMVVTMDIVFDATYSGAKNIYLYAAEQNTNSGFASMGTWTVTGGSPTANSVSPASGAGGVNPSAIFTLTVADSATYENLSGLAALFTTGSPGNTANACYVVYQYPLTVGLYANDGVTLNTKGLGSSGTLQNSQCAVGFTSAAVSGTTMTLTVQIQFNASFDGAKTVYLEANEPATSSGWVSRGIWTVQ